MYCLTEIYIAVHVNIYIENLLSKGKVKYSDFIKSSNLFFNEVQSINEAERISKLIKKRIK